MNILLLLVVVVIVMITATKIGLFMYDLREKEEWRIRNEENQEDE